MEELELDNSWLENLEKIEKKYDLFYITTSPTGLGFFKDSLIILLAKLYRKNIIFHFHGKGIKKFYYRKNLLL